MRLSMVVQRDGSVSEEVEAVPGSPGDVRVTLDAGCKLYGRGVGVSILAELRTDGTPEGRAAAYDAAFAEFEAALRRNRDRLQRWLRASLADVGDGRLWDPSGDSLADVRPVAPPPPGVIPPPPAVGRR